MLACVYLLPACLCIPKVPLCWHFELYHASPSLRCLVLFIYTPVCWATLNTASRPVSDVHVFVWACLRPPPMRPLSSSLPLFHCFLPYFFSLCYWNFLALISKLLFFFSVFSMLWLLWREVSGDSFWLCNWDQTGHGPSKRSQTDTDIFCASKHTHPLRCPATVITYSI